MRRCAGPTQVFLQRVRLNQLDQGSTGIANLGLVATKLPCGDRAVEAHLGGGAHEALPGVGNLIFGS